MFKMSSASEYEYKQRSFRTKIPYVEVVEQPSPNMYRFRYECELRSAGCIMGINSSPENKTYPSIKVHGYAGSTVAVVISCVTKDDPPKSHPHSIVGNEFCKKGICHMEVNLNSNGVVSFRNLAIMCLKRVQVKDALAIRKRERIDPFMAGFEHADYPNSIDLNAVRLCFQVFIRALDGRLSVPLKPVATKPMYNKNTAETLAISNLSHHSAPVAGDMEMILLCGKVAKDDIQVRFFEKRGNCLFWDDYGKFLPTNVHKKVAIVFKTPKYCSQDITEPVDVYIQLRKKSDGTTSNAVPFQMLPLDVDDMSSIKRKRLKFHNEPGASLLKQVQAEAEKQVNMSNQALLFNYMNPKLEVSVSPFGGGIVPRPSPIFQDQASSYPVNLSYNNQASQSTVGFNIPFNQHQRPQSDCRFQARTETPVPNPRFSLQAEGLSQAKPRSVLPWPQTRPRTEHPCPNVTVVPHPYGEPMFAKYRERESRHSYNQQPQVVTDRDDPFDLDNLPCNMDQLSPHVLAVLGTTNSNDISESLSENLSKGLSISDQQDTSEICPTLPSIRELNNDGQVCQEYGEINFWRKNERSYARAVRFPFNAFPRQTFDKHVDQARLFP